MNKLLVGAGRDEIALPEDLFPTEGFTHQHDELFVRVIVIDKGNRIVLISVELTSIPGDMIDDLRKLVGAAAETLPEYVVISVTHTLSTPHFVPSHRIQNEKDQKKNDLLSTALAKAISNAVSLAIASMQPARYGFATGTCDVNVNRDIETSEGWWLGCSETGPSDKSVPVIRFDSLDGQPIALFYSYAIQSSVMNDAVLSHGGLEVSSDMTGVSSRFVENAFDDQVVALFFIGAAADQAPAYKAKHQYVGKGMRLIVENFKEAGYVMMEMLGKRLGVEILRIAEQIKCQDLSDAVSIEEHRLEFQGQEIIDMRKIHSTHKYEYLPGMKREEPLYVLRLGEVIVIGVRPELSCRTAQQIQLDSPYRQTIVLTMVNGGAKYMAEALAYDRITYEGMNSFFARGSAEKLCDEVSKLLHDKQGK